jgi:hypothetical protein
MLRISVRISLPLLFLFLMSGRIVSAEQQTTASGKTQQTPAPRTQAARQLLAVRGEVTRIKPATKGFLLITIKPAKDFPEVTVLARENDLVGSAVGRANDSDLLGLLTETEHDDETITAAELNEGDIVSVIYDPQLQNKVLEIYLR